MSATELSLGNGRFIPKHELTFRATRAGGPGGQHVNTSSTRVEVLWNVSQTVVLSDDEKSRLRRKLPTRIAANGVMRVVASQNRSQHLNRERAQARLAELVRDALAVQRKRKPTTPTRSSVERRLEEKKRHAKKKQQRAAIED